MIPYEYEPGMPRQKRKFNKLLSQTRIIVEQTLGLLKGRFRLLKTVLAMKSSESTSDIVVSCMVLHNMLLDANDPIEIIYNDPLIGLHRRHIANRRRDDQYSRNRRDEIAALL
jgi:hypothetical protein